jgi:hypothetical protein
MVSDFQYQSNLRTQESVFERVDFGFRAVWAERPVFGLSVFDPDPHQMLYQNDQGTELYKTE